MTLMKAILNKVKSTDCLIGKCNSPPPETKKIEEIELKIKKKRPRRHPYSDVVAKVDTSPPTLDFRSEFVKIKGYEQDLLNLNNENIKLILAIKGTHFTRGKVDSRWEKELPRTKLYYENRVNFWKQTDAENLQIYKRITSTESKLPTSRELEKDWKINRREIIRRAFGKFVLFPPIPTEDVEDPAFLPAKGYKRPRMYMTLKLKKYSYIGDLLIELFTDVCPLTCKLFAELFDGDDSGYSYVGTEFFRKVPHLYWTGGDVVYNNGFGCYAQKGRCIPIGAENFHFSHSIPGLLSMRVTKNDEVCGIFNITFKAIPQLDLRNVVFGRVVRPSDTLNNMAHIGAALSSVPVVEVAATRHNKFNKLVCGRPNTRLQPVRPKLKQMIEMEAKKMGIKV